MNGYEREIEKDKELAQMAFENAFESGEWTEELSEKDARDLLYELWQLTFGEVDAPASDRIADERIGNIRDVLHKNAQFYAQRVSEKAILV